MARQRERFERIDVPRPSHTRTVVSAVVVVVVFVALFITLSTLWNKADSYSTYNDSTLEDAVDSQETPAAVAGATKSADDFTTSLFLTTDDSGTLVDARVVAVDETAGTLVVAELPLDLSVTTEAGTLTLSTLIQQSGGAACVVPVSTATGIAYDHVFVCQESFWTALTAYSESGSDSALTDMRKGATSDLSNRKVDDYYKELAAADIDAAIAAPAAYPVYAGDAGSTIDAAQLNIALGLYVVA
ncbi:MAG: hypothetical protein ACI361_07255 [Atopobiaceae bacterium]